MTTNELNEFFHVATTPPVSTDGEILKPEPTEAQKAAIWQELLLQEEMFKDEIFLNHK